MICLRSRANNLRNVGIIKQNYLLTTTNNNIICKCHLNRHFMGISQKKSGYVCKNVVSPAEVIRDHRIKVTK